MLSFVQNATLARLWEVDAPSLFALLRSYCKLSPSHMAGMSRLVSLLGGLPGFGDVALAPLGPSASDLLLVRVLPPPPHLFPPALVVANRCTVSRGMEPEMALIEAGVAWGGVGG